MHQKKSKKRFINIWNRSFFPVLFTYFIDNFGQAIVYPIFTPLFLKPHFDLFKEHFTLFHRTFLLGLLIASFSITQFFGAPLFGRLSDRFGRKRMFIVTICGGILGYFLTGFGIHIRNIYWLWTGRALAGFFAGNLSLCLAAIADITHSKQDRTRNFGWVGTLAGLGFILAILLGGSLSNPDLLPFFHPEVPFFVTGIFFLIDLCLLTIFFKDRYLQKPHDRISYSKGTSTLASAIKTKGVRGIYVVYFLFILSWITSLQFLSAYLLDNYKVSQNVITFAFIGIGIAWFFANFILHPFLSKRISPVKIFLFGLLFLSFFLFFTLIQPQPLFLFLTHFILGSMCAGLSWTNGLALLSLSATKFIQGSILGVNQSVVAIAFIIGPILGGFIAGIDIHKLYLFTAFCGLAGALLLFIHSSGIKKV